MEGTFRPAENRDPDEDMVSRDPTSEPGDECELGLLPNTGRLFEPATNFLVPAADFLSGFDAEMSLLSAATVVAVALPDDSTSPSIPPSSSE